MTLSQLELSAAQQSDSSVDADVPTHRLAVVAATIPPDFGGAGLSAFKLAERLHRQGRLAFVLTRSRVEGNGRRGFAGHEGLPQVPEARVVRVQPQQSQHGRQPNLLLDALRFGPSLMMLVASTSMQLFRRRRDYEVVQCFSPNWLSFCAILTAKLLGKQAILEATLIEQDEPQARPPRDLLGFKYLARRTQYRLADQIVAISPALGRRIAESGYAHKVRVIPRSVDVSRFHPATEQEQQRLRRELGIGDQCPLLLFVGHIGERKGADLLVPILSKVVKRVPDATLVIVGEAGVTRANMEIHERMLADIARLGLEGNVHIVGWTAFIERFMKVATLFVFPSRREGFGTVVVEAMACGAVPVALRIPDVTEHIVTQGRDGVRIEVDDPKPFARAIIELLEDRSRRVRMAAAAVHTACERFSTAAVDAAYAELYAQLQRESAAAPR